LRVLYWKIYGAFEQSDLINGGLLMLGRHRLFMKLGAAVTIIVAVAIVGTAIVLSLLTRHYTLESSRSILHFNSVSVRSGIGRLMMSRDNESIKTFINDVSHGSDVYRDICLISHPSGEVIVSQQVAEGTRLELEDLHCALCHADETTPEVTAEPLDVVLKNGQGERILHVITPVLNEQGCRSADCHVHAESGPVLGFLETEYTLARIDMLTASQGLFAALSAVVAISLASVALFVMFRRSVDRPLRRMVRGLNVLAASDLTFRFPARRNDEIGFAEKSFNRLASSLQAHQAELKDMVEYFEGIVENSADMIITVNPEGLIITFNRGAEETLGYKREEVVGRRIEALFADRTERDIAIARLRESDNVRNYEAKFLTKEGEIKDVLLTLSRLRDKEGNTIGTFGISKDITHEKELLRKLVQSEKDAGIGRAIIAIQHAVKNMLNILRGGLYVVQVGQKKGDQNRIDEGREMIEEGLSRINDLSLNMLKYAREWKIEPKLIDLSSLIEKVAAANKDGAAQRGVTLRTDIDGTLPKVPCDPKLMHMTMMDIVSNALDACEKKDYEDGEEPEVVLRTFREDVGRMAVIEIEDNGMGMTEEVRRNVFTPFFTTKGKTGTGLGLALTSRIIKLHRGRIAVESELGRGAVFRIKLPLDGPGSN
jgi:PAS domain S-box-containing protein